MCEKMCERLLCLNPLSANFTKWSNTLKQFVSNLPTNCLSVFGHFVGLVLKGLNEETRPMLVMFFVVCNFGQITVLILESMLLTWSLSLFFA